MQSTSPSTQQSKGGGGGGGGAVAGSHGSGIPVIKLTSWHSFFKLSHMHLSGWRAQSRSIRIKQQSTAESGPARAPRAASSASSAHSGAAGRFRPRAAGGAGGRRRRRSPGRARAPRAPRGACIARGASRGMVAHVEPRRARRCGEQFDIISQRGGPFRFDDKVDPEFQTGTRRWLDSIVIVCVRGFHCSGRPGAAAFNTLQESSRYFLPRKVPSDPALFKGAESS